MACLILVDRLDLLWSSGPLKGNPWKENNSMASAGNSSLDTKILIFYRPCLGSISVDEYCPSHALALFSPTQARSPNPKEVPF